MATYKIEISATAERQIRKLEREDQKRVVRAIQTLASDPRPRGARKLNGYDDLFRIRVGVYRVIYSVDDERIVAIILKVGHRGDVYR